MNKSSVYITPVIDALPRVLSMLDREPFSKSYGCADRVFWSWKFIDFPGARFQEIAYVLATLFTNPTFTSQQNIRPDTLLEWTKASINYWITQQHRDGSFDEAYPYERSLAATAFTGFYVGQAFLKIEHTYTREEKTRLVRVFAALGDWLCHNDERHGILSNHLAAAAAALQTVAQITKAHRFEERRNYFVTRILKHQSQEGWYEEYGGADPGYQTHTTFYLSYVWTQTKDRKLLQSLTQSIRYFWNFIHVDGSIGGEYASRNTRFFMPAGFEMLASEIPEAASVAHFMRQALAKKSVVALDAMDTYNIFPLINNYFFANTFAQSLHHDTLMDLPFQAHGVTHFEESGHLVVSTSTYQAIISTSKGGVLSAYPKTASAKLTSTQCSNAGIILIFKNGMKASSQGLKCSKVSRVDHQLIEIESQFTAINQMLMSPEKFIAFRCVNLFSRVFPAAAYHLKKMLVAVLVRRKKICPAVLVRKITWKEDTVSIEDEIRLTQSRAVQQVYTGGRFSAIHMGSSRYFEWQDLSTNTSTTCLDENQIRLLNQNGRLTINSNWSAT